MSATLFAALTVIAVAVLLYGEYADSRRTVWVAKPLAALGFIGVAAASGATTSRYGVAVLTALCLSAVGDVLLIVQGSSRAFAGGLGAFLLGHLAFIVAFALRAPDAVAASIASGFIVVVSGTALYKLWAHVPRALAGAVATYVLVISVMVALAVGAAARTSEPTIALGAVAFYVSDLAVAIDRFVNRSFWNKAWGLPLYFGAQLVLAASVLRP